MDKSLDSVSEIVPGRLTWKVKVRVVRLWEVPTFLNPDQANSLEIVLLDEMVCDDCYSAYHFTSFFVYQFCDV